MNFSAISSTMQRISKRQNATFQYHTQCHCNCLLQKHTLRSAGVTACVERGPGPSHAHPIFLGAMGCYFCVGSMKNCYAAISRAPCMRGNAHHADRDSGRAESCGSPLWVGYKGSLLFPRQSSAQKKCAVLRLPVGKKMHDLSWH